MVILKSLLSMGFGPSRFSTASLKGNTSTVLRSLAMLMSTQAMSRQTLTKSLELVTAGPVRVDQGAVMTETPRPLVVMLAWMLAKKKHINKYCEFYVRRGCDVLTINITPWQLLWPVSGSQVVADEVLHFLHKNKSCQPLYLHGFSVGGYVWGEVMVKMKQDLPRYQPVIDRIVGQAWDSAADVTEIQVGLPLAVFPRNPIMRMALSKYIAYHLKAFDEEATSHYIRSSQMFHTSLVHSPALLLLSKTDPVGSLASNLRLKETWESMGIKVSWKCWDDSKHVSHYLKYKEEYIKTLENFWDSLNLTKKSQQEENQAEQREVQREKFQAKL
ncbi:transmembrane protein 53 [Homalodisca vitripennis]|uniref:transmembrane protein 53 n=1 Tax=Homalodisca vitripennis TaxID=197043 RepID=UPI001EE9EEA5|nr:transmembrane protein 53 [Homalodisca vitripennis]XP_046665228.1 transmembrane protein 53 [Homalodisca vitripennis]